MKLSYITIFGISLALTGAGCKKFLEQEPARQTTIKTVEQIRALLDNATGTNGFYQEDNATATFSTDDTEIPANVYAANVSR